MFETQIERILEKQRRVDAHYKHPTTHGPRATDEQIAAFETEFGVQLPLDYRAWIQQVGDGMWDECCRENDELVAFFYENDPSLDVYANLDLYAGLVTFPLIWKDSGFCGEDCDGLVIDDSRLDGDLAHVFQYAPSNQFLLLVLSGEEKGYVWICDDFDAREHRPFLDDNGRRLGYLDYNERRYDSVLNHIASRNS